MNIQYKHILQTATVVIFAIFLWIILKRCGGARGTTTVTKTDTIYQRSTDTINIPYETLVPYKVIYNKETIKHDTLETIETILQHVDSAKILQQYLAERYYSKTEEVAYGNLTINDTVSQNRITGRSIILTQDIPLIKETVTVEAKKKNMVFFGISSIFNQKELPFASGVTLDLKTRNDVMIGVGGYYTNDERGMVGVSIKFPIKLRKK